jgi:hypothetical protein
MLWYNKAGLPTGSGSVKMEHTIALQVPEKLYKAIQSQAVKQGQTPDSLAAQWLKEAIRKAETAEEDPLIKLFGTIRGDATDVAERHDYYIGQALARTVRDGA